jgi:hypothetical protein
MINGRLFNTLQPMNIGYKNGKESPLINLFYISTDENEAGNDMSLYIDNIELTSNLNALETANLLAGKTFYDFNHVSRQWEHTVYTSKELIDISFKKTNENQHSLYNPIGIFQAFKKSKGYPNFNNPYVIYDTMSNLETNIKVLRFTAYGNIVRDCGQILILDARK